MRFAPDDLKAAALEYASLGYAVFPCVPGAKEPLTEHGFKDATHDPVQIEAWWTAHPQANIGMPTNRLLVIDQEGPDLAWLAGDDEKLSSLSYAPTSRTPSLGCHSFFRQPSGKVWRNTTKRLSAAVDTRADGGYVLLPPSVVQGRLYQWIPAHALDTKSEHLPLPPAWLVEALDRLQDGKQKAIDRAGNTIPEGQRNTTLASLAGAMRRHGMSEAEILAALECANQDRCKPPLAASEVAKIARSVSRYEPDSVAVAVVEDHYAQDFAGAAERESVPAHADPGPLPDAWLRVPGLISEVMDYTLDTAPYPNTVLAFCGALALQAFLAGRKVRDPGDNRTNLYLLGLAHSASGKDWPRKVNTRILYYAGLEACLGDRFASGEGIQDALAVSPSMLFQTDEIDGLLQSITRARDARHESILGTLLTMYTSSNSVFPMRRKAGENQAAAINQPSLVVFGTAIPNHYYAALSERLLTNGFFARTATLESGARGKGQEPRMRDLPPRVLVTAKWWAEFRPGSGNLGTWHPTPANVEQTEEARRVLIATREEAEVEYAKAEARNDAVATTVWGRVSEQSRKLALIYAVSENHAAPMIGKTAVTWASRFVVHQARRMLYMALQHVAESPFQAECLRVIQKLRASPGCVLSHSVLLKRMKMTAKSFTELIQTLEQRGEIEQVIIPRHGTSKRHYRLREERVNGE